MYTLYLISVWMHILAAIVWIGGMAFIVMVLAPFARSPERRDIAISIIRWTGMRFRTIGWSSLALLIVTGLVNLHFRGYGWTDLSSPFWSSTFGHILALKLLLVSLILMASAVHDFIVGPKAGIVAQKSRDSAEALRLRRQAAWLGRINMILSLLVVALAVLLVRGLP